MINEKYVVTHDGDVLRSDLTQREAILCAATYDGWGAEFARDDDGVMGLRRSEKHIGNNPWLARGSEAPLFGITSILQSDEEAICDVVERLYPIVRQLHNLMEVQTHSQHAIDTLKCAIDSYEGETGPGYWGVKEKTIMADSFGQSRVVEVGLVYEWPSQGRGECAGDEPWTQWGGGTIIHRAGCVPISGYSQNNEDTCAIEWLPKSQRGSPLSHQPAETFFWHLRDNTDLEKKGIVQIPSINQDQPLLIQLPAHLMLDFSLASAKIDDAIVETNRLTQQGRDGTYFETLQAELAKVSIRTLDIPRVLHSKHCWDSDCTDVLGNMSEADQTDVEITNALAVIEHGDEDMFSLESGSEIDPSHRLLININRIKITYPRSDRYGVPDCATDAGARMYLKDLGFHASDYVEVETEDSGDDTPMQLTIWGKAPDNIIETPESETSREVDR